jgi:hypothetical protein
LTGVAGVAGRELGGVHSDVQHDNKQGHHHPDHHPEENIVWADR